MDILIYAERNRGAACCCRKNSGSYIKPDGKVDFGKAFEKIDFEKIKEIDIIACGTAYHAGLQAAYFFKKNGKNKNKCGHCI